MTLDELKALLNVFREQGGDVAERLNEESALLNDVEVNLGLRFPQSLRDFYSCYEYLQIGGDEFTWIRRFGDVIEQARRSRRRVPKNYLPVMADGTGGYYFAVCAQPGKPEPNDFGSVVYCPGTEPGVSEHTSSDFLDFVRQRIELWRES